MAYLNAQEAADFLGVEKSTLYAYVSRGLLSNARSEEDGRRRQYRKADLERLKRRRAARRGHEAAAADALQWGPASLTTSVERMSPTGPAYRGIPLRRLLNQNATFEDVASLLWTGERSLSTAPWPADPSDINSAADRIVADDLHPIDECMAILQATRHTDQPPQSQARRLVQRLPLAHGLSRRGDVPDAAENWTIAASLGWTLGLDGDAPAIDLLETTLVVAATHGLNVSTFAGRVAASSGAPLRNCMIAALAAFSGPRHGLHCQNVAKWFQATSRVDDAHARVEAHASQGEELPGFGHPFYEHGDPRFEIIHRRVAELGRNRERIDVLDALVEAADDADTGAPTLDVGLVYVCEALGLAPSHAPLIFACGRAVGWIAHILEQREAGFLLRPRSDYQK